MLVGEKNLKKLVGYPETFLIYSESSICKKVHQDHVDSRVFFTLQDASFLRGDLSHFCVKNDTETLLFGCIILNSTFCTPTCRVLTFQPFLKKQFYKFYNNCCNYHNKNYFGIDTIQKADILQLSPF